MGDAMKACILCLAVILFSPAAFAQQPAGCPATASLGGARFIPPAPYQSSPDRGTVYYGSDRLWVQLDERGQWRGLYRSDLRAYRNKLMLFRKGFDWTRERRPPLTITATWLDNPALRVTSAQPVAAFNE